MVELCPWRVAADQAQDGIAAHGHGQPLASPREHIRFARRHHSRALREGGYIEGVGRYAPAGTRQATTTPS